MSLRLAYIHCINLFYSEYVHMSRSVCQFIGFLYILLLYSGTSLHGGIVQETKRTQEGVLLPNFFLTYLLATKLVKNKPLKLTTSPCVSTGGSTWGLSKKVTCLRGRVAEWPSGRVAKINFG